MTTTTICAMTSSMEDTARLVVPKMTVSGKMKHRPRNLNIDPFDPDELNRKLSVVVTESFHSPQSPFTQLSVDTPNSPSPRSTSMEKPSEPLPTKSRKSSIANAVPQQRRGSLLDRLGFGKGSNYSEKEIEEERTNKPAPYKHVPKVAAEQFARTTTVEPLTQKVSPTKHMRSSPGPHSVGTLSLQDYNRQCRRSQSLCSGRLERANSSSHSFSTVLESTAEVDEEPPLTSRSAQPHVWNSGFELGPEAGGRRMSTGNMWGGPDSNQPHVSFRRDSTGLGGLHMQKSNGSLDSGLRRGSNSSSTVFSFDNASPFQRDSGLASPYRSEFRSVSPMREESGNSSRRGSVAKVPNPQATANLHRPDWSQSDQSNKQRRDSKWSINSSKSRKTSLSQKSSRDESEALDVGPEVKVDALLPTKAPKTGFLRRFRH